MLTLNSLQIPIHILKHSVITTYILHINSKLLIASFIQLILNFLQFSVLCMKYFEFNLQYLEVASRFLKTFLKTLLRMLLKTQLLLQFLLLILTLILTLILKSKLSTFLPYPLTNIWFILCPLRSFLLQFSK